MLRRLILLLVLWPVVGYSVHITDKLLADMYAEPSNTGSLLKSLPSGTPVDLIVEKGKFVKIRLLDGKVGWVEKHFLSEDKPAKVRLLELQSKYRQLHGKLDVAETKLAEIEAQELKKKSESLHQGETTEELLQAELEKASKEVTALRKELEKPKGLENKSQEKIDEKNEYSSGVGWFVFFLMFILSAVGGVFLGLFIQDRKQMKRHGGFRL